MLCMEYKLNIQWVPKVPQGVNQLWGATDLSPTSTTQLNNGWSYTSIPRVYLCSVNRDNFTSFPFYYTHTHTHKINISY